jgi:prepilin-type processing-associated H-X9-DG protein/prepilin-type N-terminal cleavage/methylation domain-containing protein
MMARSASPAGNPRQLKTGGFTLVELLVVLVVIAVLAGIAAAAYRSTIRKADRIQCMHKLKSLGTATILYSQDNQDQLPRSFHSAAAYRQPGWAVSIAPYLGVPASQIETSWPAVFQNHFRSPTDHSTDPFVYSYGLNVHFELNPDGDDYTGSPATWRRLTQIPSPANTILMGQTKPVRFGDHLMCHQWSGIQSAKNALNHAAHSGKANYLFVDGHVETLAVEETFNPTRHLNRWNPSLAR